MIDSPVTGLRDAIGKPAPARRVAASGSPSVRARESVVEERFGPKGAVVAAES